MGARERATIDIVEQAGRQRDLGRFVQQLNLNGRLTPSLLMRGLCLGHIDFVEHAMAELGRHLAPAHVAADARQRAAWAEGGVRSRRACRRGCFRLSAPRSKSITAIDREGGAHDRITFRKRMLERTLTLFQSVPKDDLDYLLEKLDASGLQDRARAAI